MYNNLDKINKIYGKIINLNHNQVAFKDKHNNVQV
jgi:hypothetical protein